MAKKRPIENPHKKKNDGTISGGRLLSCYVASALIVLLCVMEALKPETQEAGDVGLYVLLAVLGVLFSVFITIRSRKNQREKEEKGVRLSDGAPRKR